MFEYGKTWEGRELVYAAIGSEENIRRLAEIKAAMHKLYDPRRTPAAEAQKLMQGLPAVIWLAYGVHGNEISSPDAALVTAYHLLAARNDELVKKVLANVVVMIDPSQNPDGRNRFVHNYEVAAGLEPDAEPLAAEHNEPWPGGRTNHYYFDLNRDWLVMTQPETAGHIKALQEWYPLVFVDLHEMGTESTYYFTPEAVPYNPNLTEEPEGAAAVVRQEQREVLRPVRIQLLHSRGLRRLLSRIRRELAVILRRPGDDLRERVDARDWWCGSRTIRRLLSRDGAAAFRVVGRDL